MSSWWGWDDFPTGSWFNAQLEVKGKTTFKLYDDDGELYYAGWLVDDDQAFVQQFVLSWAQADSGCTTIKVHRPGADQQGEYVQEIG